MDLNKVRIGLRVKTTEVGPTTGMMINEKALNCRESGIQGTVMDWVPGHGGDVWWVKHDNGAVGAYVFTEFEPL